MAVAVIGSVSVALEFYMVRGQGSIPQPRQKLTSIDRAESGGGAIVGAEVIPQTMVLRCLAGGRPADASVVIGAVPHDVGEGGAVHGGGGELREL